MGPRKPTVLLLLAVFAALGVESSIGQRIKRSYSLSERLIMTDDSGSDPPGNSIDGTRSGSQRGRDRGGERTATTTMGPPMTFRGRAPTRPTTTPVTLQVITTRASWYRRFVPSETPEFVHRVGQFFGRRGSPTTSVPVTSTTEASFFPERPDEEGGVSRRGNATLDDFDIRVMIDAPSISDDSCPSGHRRSRSGRCRPILR